ncbi:MAG: hypothetical protein IPK13_11740 [Deltaproteobacteria bacterium]|nr:hypothetical protein [Deltaproteobacteria bacterium]
MTNTVRPERAEAAFEKLRARIEALPKDAVTSGAVSHDEAASKILGVIEAMRAEPSIPATLRTLPREIFDAKHLDALDDLTLALLHARRKAISEASTSSGVTVPVTVIEKAAELKATMTLVLEYYVGHEPEAALELAAIRSGTGYLDLANDLSQLAALYGAHAKTLKQDKLRYDPAHVAQAREVSFEIRRHYGSVSTGNTWSQTCWRVFTLLEESYQEVRDAVSYVYRHKRAVVDLFPTLRLGGRRRPTLSTDSDSRPRPGDDTEAGADGEAP